METFRLLIGPDESANPWQMCARALILLVFGLVCIRIAGRRTFAQASPLDIIVAIVVGSNISRIMTGKASFFGGIAASLALVLLHRAARMATLKWSWLAKLTQGEPAVLVRDGEPDRRAMGRHAISDADLRESLRLQGLETVEDVRLATLEDSGSISVIEKKPA